MKKSLCIEMVFTELDFYKRFEAAKLAGFDYVEFWSWDDKNLDKIKDLCEVYNLKIASFSGDKEYSLVDLDHVEAYVDYVTRSIDAAKFLDCKHLVIHSNALGENGVVVNHYLEKSAYEKFGVMVKILERLAPIAEKNDVTLVLEALNTVTDHVGNFLRTTEEAVTAVKIVGSSHIKVLYDAYHMQLNEGKLIENIQAYHHYIGYIHIADAPGRMEPGTGEINYSNVFKSLKDVNYPSFIGFELSPSKTSKEVAKDLVNLF